MFIRQDGVFSDHQIFELYKNGFITSQIPLEPDQIQPASLDLRLSSKAYRVRSSFLAGRNRPVQERIAEFGMHEIDLTHGAALEKGCVYIVPLIEALALEKDIHAVANAKSSTGRLDLLTRLITDGGTEFDRVVAGYHGPLYAEICPRSFSVLARQGSKLNQLRLRRGHPALSDPELEALNAKSNLILPEADINNGLGFSVDLKDRLVGYQARPHTGIIDVDKSNGYSPGEYWNKVYANDGKIILDPGSFYILASRESVSIPPIYAAEMIPYLPVVGEFRVHYAGFFDPGFGHDESGGTGSRAVLEVRCHEVPFLLEHGQKVGKLIFEKMLELPMAPYGSKSNSNYQGQGLKLSKHFAQSF